MPATLGTKYYLRSGSEGEKNLETEVWNPKTLLCISYARLVFSSAWRIDAKHTARYIKGGTVGKLL